MEIYGKWESLKKFYNDNWGETILNIKKNNISVDIEMIEWERGLFREKMDSMYYVFLTKEIPPLEWLKTISSNYKDLDFNLGYQNRKTSKIGEVVYKQGENYYNEEEIL